MAETLNRKSHLLNITFWHFLIPLLIQSAALRITMLIDSLMVANLLGAKEMAAVEIGQYFDCLTDVPQLLCGIGGSILVGSLLGQGEREKADAMFNFSLYCSLALSILIAMLGFFAEPIAVILTNSVDATLTNGVAAYIRVVAFTSPVIMYFLCLCKFVSIDGFVKLGSLYYFVSNCINLIFDWILLKYTPLGIAGAALANTLGYLLGGVVFLGYFLSKKRMLHFQFKISIKMQEAWGVIKTGYPNLQDTFLTVAIDAIRTIIITGGFGILGILSFTLYNKLFVMIMIMTAGLFYVLRITASILNGEKDYYGLLLISKKVLRFTIIISSIVAVLTMICPQILFRFFAIENNHAEIASVLRVAAISVPLAMIVEFWCTYYQSTQKIFLAVVVTMLKSGVFAAIFLLLAALYSEQLGISASRLFPVCIVLGSAVSLMIIAIYHFSKGNGFKWFMVDTADQSKEFDVTLKASYEQAAVIAEAVQNYCVASGASANLANKVGIAAEEMVCAVIQFKDDRDGDIDLNVRAVDGQIVLRVRDNGKPFNPLEYNVDENSEIDSITMVRKLAKEIKYSRVMDMNNTIVVF